MVSSLFNKYNHSDHHKSILWLEEKATYKHYNKLSINLKKIQYISYRSRN